MKKVGSLLLSFCLALTLVLPAAPSSTNAQAAINHLEDNNKKTFSQIALLKPSMNLLKYQTRNLKLLINFP